MLSLPSIDFNDVQEKWVTQFRPWQCSFQFWVRTTNIYTGYKVFQLRVRFVKDAKKQEEMWENHYEVAAEKIHAMCSDLGGFFLKVAQIMGKPDLAPAALVKKLVTLCDQQPRSILSSVCWRKSWVEVLGRYLRNLTWILLVLPPLHRCTVQD